MLRILLSLFITLMTSGAALAARPIIIFDLDRTLFNPEPRIAAILRDVNAGDLSDPVEHERVFGSRGRNITFNSPFGQRFFFDSSYLQLDTPMPGAAEFVTRIATALNAEIVYLTGRQHENFEEPSRAHLMINGFPSGRMYLKHASDTRPTDKFKLGVINDLQHHAPVIAIFDDSTRNIRTFLTNLTHAVVIAVDTPDYDRDGNRYITAILGCQILLAPRTQP